MTNTCRNCDAPNDTGMLVCEACFARFTGQEAPQPADPKARWGTSAEISFVRSLDTAAVRKYVEAAGLRTNWDGINSGAVISECRRLLNG